MTEQLCPDQGAPVPPDFRALCAELADVLAQYVNLPDDPEAVALLRHARAALAQPVPPRPTDEEIIDFWSDHCAGDGHAGILRLARWGYEQRGAVNEAELQQARDEELEACCETLENQLCCFVSDDLHAARRPKPPSLKEQALEILDLGHEGWGLANDDWQTLRRALEGLPE